MPDLRTHVSDFCRKHRLRIDTDLGQHFLVDGEILERIVQAARVKPGQDVVEIGPGIGILTLALLEAGAKVHAVELDRRLIPLLQEYVRESPAASALEVTAGDALEAPLPTFPYAVVANIPYQITSPLIRRLVNDTNPPVSMTLLIQKEVAEHLTGKSEPTILSVVVALFGTAEYVCTVPKEAFLPPPKVVSAVVHIRPHATAPCDAETKEKVISLLKLANSQKRKKLINTIGTLPRGMERMAAAGINPDKRPHMISVQEWITLAKTV